MKAARVLLHPLRIAFVLLTTLPVGYPVTASAADQRRSLYLYPVVGLGIGVLLWVTALLLPPVPLLSALLVVALWVGLTGALHLDGLADSVDAWVGGHGDRQRTLVILRDPAAGPMAVVALILLLALKWAALTQLLAQGETVALLAVPVMGRAAVILLYATTPYVRRGGLGESLKPVYGDRHWMTLSAVASGLAMLILLGLMALVAAMVALVVFILIRKMSVARLHGFTGDVAGALVELIEAIALVTLALALHH